MKPGPQDKRYEKLYGALQDRADWLHQNNKAMIKWGSITMIALPFILFFIRWMTDSNKVAFLLIWVFCLFAIAAFLIAVEYMDHRVEGALRDITGGGERFDRLIQPSSKFTKRLTANVVTIMVLIGLCVIPCLYAWFNIFSNWDPYSPSATGRITVAVANEDEGADMVGMNVNVGEKLTDTLEANRDIGWTMVGSEEKAMEGLYAGDYYAAIVIPKDFSEDVLSFTTGDLNHPELDYYENVKKNAIAPKITNKAMEVLKTEVDAAFIETLGKYVSEAKEAADAEGLDPEDVFGDLSERIGLLSERMDDLVALVAAAQGLSDAAGELLQASGDLAGSTEDALRTGEQVLEDEEGLLPDKSETRKVSDSIKEETAIIDSGLKQAQKDLKAAGSDLDAFNQFVEKDLIAHEKLVKDMAASAEKTAKQLEKLGLDGLAARFHRLADALTDIGNRLGALEKADEETWPETKKEIEGILGEILSAINAAESISADIGAEVDSAVDQALSDTRNAIDEIRGSLEDSYGSLDNLTGALSKSEKALRTLDGGLGISMGALKDMQNSFDQLSKLFDSMADSDEMKNINYLLSDGTDVIARNLAAPIQMNTETIYPVKNFGSMMASFYTALAQWVGALFAGLLIRARIRRKEEEGAPQRSLLGQFFGRYRLFLAIGLVQAIILTAGELLYAGIQCVHPFLFILTACISALVFTMINYGLCFALGKLGSAISLIILILQVAGSGGTFPPEVYPGFFQHLYPFLPFRYCLVAMRECVAGTYGADWIINIAIFLLFGAIAAAIGLLLARPGQRLDTIIHDSVKKSDIVEW